MIQLARKLCGLTVVATASRPESAAKVREWGANHVCVFQYHFNYFQIGTSIVVKVLFSHDALLALLDVSELVCVCVRVSILQLSIDMGLSHTYR